MINALTKKYQLHKGRMKRLSSESMYVVIGQICVVLTSLIIVRILTEKLEPSQYGQLSLALTLGTLIGQVSFSGAMPGISRFYSIAREKSETGYYLSASIRMMTWGLLFAFILSFILLLVLNVLVSLLAIIFSVIGNFNTIQSLVQNSARKRNIVAITSISDGLLRVFFVLVLFHFFDSIAATVITAYIFSAIIVFLMNLYFTKRLIKHQIDKSSLSKKWVKEIWLYSKPFVYFNTFTWMQASSDRWAIDLFSTKEDVGLYAVLMQIGFMPATIIGGLVMTIATPILFQRSGDATDTSRNLDIFKQLWTITFISLAVTFAASFFAGLCHDLVFELFVGDRYHSASHLLPWVTLAGGLFATGQLLSIKMMSDLNTKALVWPKIITSVAGVILSFGGAYMWGLVGVIMATVAFSVLQIVSLGWLSRHPLT